MTDCEIERQVAEKVFGITVLGVSMVGTGGEGEEFVRQGADPNDWMCNMELRPVMLDRCVCEPEDLHRFPKGSLGHNDCCLQAVPLYTVNAFMEVVERMKARGYFVSLHNSEGWYVNFWKKIPRVNDHEGRDESVGRAVCFAALQALATESAT